jgi:predicted Zn-dependent protease
VPPPGQDQLVALAERALSHCEGEAQATARWSSVLQARAEGGERAEGVVVEVAVVADGRTGLLATADTSDDGLRRAAAGAGELARAGGGARGARLGDPAPGRAHAGYDPAALGPAAVPDGAALAVLATKVAIVSTRGVRSYEQRTAAELHLRREAAGGRALTLAEAAVRAADLDAAALHAEAAELLGDGEPVAADGGEHVVVLGPWAVAAVLRRLAPAFAGRAALDGPLAGRFGTRVVAPNINLSDSPRYPSTLPRSYDAEGVAASPVPLIQDGVAHRAVHDSTTAAAAGTASTGHATLPGGLAPPRPDHLVLVGGGAAGLAELAAPIERGLLIASLAGDRAEGVRHIRDGRIAEPATDPIVWWEPLALLGGVQALTSRQRAVPGPSGAVTVCPGLRTAALRVLG